MFNPNFRKLFYYLAIQLFLLGSSTGISNAQWTRGQIDSIKQAISQVDEEKRLHLIVQHFETITEQNPQSQRILIDSIAGSSITEDTSTLLDLQILRSFYYYHADSAEKGINLSHRIKNDLHASDKQKAQANLLLRNFYHKIAQYDKALEAHFDINWKHLSQYWEAEVPNYFPSLIYYNLGKYDIAIDGIKRSISELKTPKNQYWKISLNNNLGLYFEKANEFDSALHYYNHALRLLQENYAPSENLQASNYNFLEGLLSGNKAQVLVKQGKFLEAIPLLKKDIEASSTDGSFHPFDENKINSMLLLTDCYLKTNNLDMTSSLMKQLVAQGTVRLYKLPNYWRTKAELAEQTGDISTALYATKKQHQLLDSIQTITNQEKAENLLIAFETAKEKEILENQRIELENLTLENEEQKTIIYLILIISVLFVVVIVILLIAYRAKSSHNDRLKENYTLIERQKAELSSSLKEKEILFREVNHRVKNNLQIVSSLLFFHSKIVKDEMSKNALKDAQTRIQSMSFIHQKLYQTNNVGIVDLEDFSESLIAYIVKLHKSKQVSISCEVDAANSKVSVQKAIPLGLILHELTNFSLQNTSEHSDLNQINIKISATETTLAIEYQDLSHKEDFSPILVDETISKKLIHLLTNQLNGTISQNENHPHSLFFSFRLSNK